MQRLVEYLNVKGREGSWDSIVRVVNRLWTGWSGVRIPAEARDVYIL